MSEKHSVSYTRDELSQMPSLSNLEAVARMSEEELEARIKSDPDSDTSWPEGEVFLVSLQPDVAKWCVDQPVDMHALVNTALREYIASHPA